MKLNLEKKVKEFVEESFRKEKLNYRNTIKNHIAEGFTFEKSDNIIETSINKKLDDVKFDRVYKDLSYSLRKIEEGYNKEEFDKAISSEEFQNELKIKNTTVDQFINIHKEYLAENEVLKFHHQNREIFKKYFMIKYNDKLKYKIDYNDLNLYRGGENEGFVNIEVERLGLILNPPSKNKEYKLQKYGKGLTTRDVSVFMNLFKVYYKIDVSSDVEFVNITKLFFDDLHYNIEAGDSTLGTSIDRFLNGKELLSGKFNFEESKERILEILSTTNLKDFKKYVEKVKTNKFESLVSRNTSI